MNLYHHIQELSYNGNTRTIVESIATSEHYFDSKRVKQGL